MSATILTTWFRSHARQSSRSDIVIFTGGLGPTEDDLTRECVAAALGVELRRDHDMVAAMYKRFAERRIQMPPNNAKQADVVQGAVVLPNPRGTAPGQWLETSHRWRSPHRHPAARDRLTNWKPCGAPNVSRACSEAAARRNRDARC